MKLKDFINVLADIYNITLYDDGDRKKLFHCTTDSKALEYYADWDVVEVSIMVSLIPSSEIKICIKG